LRSILRRAVKARRSSAAASAPARADQTREALRLLLNLGFEIAWVGRTNHEYLFVRAAPGK
jgi:hypothetical protein